MEKIRQTSKRMSKLESTIISLHRLGYSVNSRISAVALLFVTLIYLFVILSIPLYAPQILIWFAIFPVMQSEFSGIGFGSVFLKSLWVLPLIVIIGIFNPFMDRTPAFTIDNIVVSRGMVSFFSIILRGLMAVQAVIILTLSTGFYDICNAMRKLGCPKILVVQLQFTYRYMIVIVEEALWMDRAMKARGYGKSSYPFKVWGRMIGQLIVRSYERSIRIHNAMLARGFNGEIPQKASLKMDCLSWIYLILCPVVMILARIFL